MAGRFDEAAARCASMPRERLLAVALKALAAHWATVRTPDDLLAPALEAIVHQVKSSGVDPLNRALERGLLLRTADLLLAHGPALLHEGRLAADLLREAGQTQRAADAYRLAQEAFPGRARIGRANALTSLGRGDEARSVYREAFLMAPEEAGLRAVDDPAVQAVVDAVEELEDEAHPRWVPVLGELDRLWPLPRAEDALDETLRAFLGALVAARAAMRIGHPDVGARRELRRLAPRLFRRLLNEGRC
jgi:tetratricopeptide (TPR) repeat protein